MAAKTTKTKRAKKTPLELLQLQIVKGFEKTYSEDRSCYWYSKKIKGHAFLKDLEVCIQEAPRAKHLLITVYCAPQGDDKEIGFVVIHEVLFTTELQLIKLLDWLENGKAEK